MAAKEIKDPEHRDTKKHHDSISEASLCVSVTLW
jgi:hypothetical protein